MSSDATQKAGRPGDVIRRILERQACGQPVNSSTVRHTEKGLSLAVGYCFGNWTAELRASGIDPEKVSANRSWTPERIVQAIHDLDSQGVALHIGSVVRVDPGLGRAASVHLGSWDEALRAAGYDPKDIRRVRPRWTRAGVIALIRERMAAKLPVSSRRMAPSSAHAIGRRLFGSRGRRPCARRGTPRHSSAFISGERPGARVRRRLTSGG